MNDLIKSNKRDFILNQLKNGQKYVRNWFSNMLPFDEPFEYHGIYYNTPENYYQAMKLPTNNTVGRYEISLMSPFAAKKQIRNKKRYIWRDDWDKNTSLKVMRYILAYKFQKGTSWFDKLKSTGDSEIVEWNNWNDIFWGKNVFTGDGENNLGKILINIRSYAK